jgi:hypothetical protein
LRDEQPKTKRALDGGREKRNKSISWKREEEGGIGRKKRSTHSA